jgi:hypothetical protein
MIFAFRNPVELSPENTNKVIGKLSDFPKEGTHDESDDYIGLWITGHDNFYEFSSCSHNKKIENEVRKLSPGDSVILHVEKSSSYTSYVGKGGKYKTYRICDAYADELGKIITFSQYNNCKEFQANTFLPILGIAMIVLGLFMFFNKFNSTDNLMNNKYLNVPENIEGEKNEFIKIKPNAWSYIFRNSGFPLIMIIAGVFIGRPFDPEETNILGIIFLLIGVYGFLHLIIIHDEIYYIIDKEGLHLKKVSYIFQPEIERIGYREIREVITEQGIFESDLNIGTVKIHKGVYNDGEIVYSKLIGIRKYKDIAMLIRNQAGIKIKNR